MNYSVNNKRNKLIVIVVICLTIMLWGCKKKEEHKAHDCSNHSTEEVKEATIDHTGHNHAEGEHIEENTVDHSGMTTSWLISLLVMQGLPKKFINNSARK